ncbi:polysaccharide biosynthesis/export family protein [Thalassotalea mangrovi]|uniref:polysaccharide biosynthesis/export family protein n=1 Tax=Thalassotalea mangrovi TaxID=2572245 RepID=UPI00145D6CED|nr:polysaccharide biosynthesis/export family protein [Thalassotalea mangrovi]
MSYVSALVFFVWRNCGYVITTSLLVLALSNNAMAQATAEKADSLELDNHFRLNSHSSVRERVSQIESSLVMPFGSSLFQQSKRIESNAAVRPQYRLRSGDVISIWMWGAFEYQQQHKIDSRGQIFLEQVGPVEVAGVSVANLSDYLQKKLAKVYHSGVELYANLQEAAPVAILVSGAVNAPGQYLGASGDGVLFFLNRAQGIDIRRGSFRRIELQRDGETIEKIDLYPFLQRGELANSALQDFDVIFVRQSQLRVNVILPNQLPVSYELLERPAKGQELLSLLSLPGYISQVTIVNEGVATNVKQNYSLEEFRRQPLKDGDSIIFAVREDQAARENNRNPARSSHRKTEGHYGSG